MIGDGPPLVRNAANAEQVRRAGRVTKDREAQRLDDLRVILKIREGRSLLWDLLISAGLYRTSLDPAPTEVYRLEGQRQFGLDLLAAIMRADMKQYLLMEREARLRKQHENRATEAAHGGPPAEDEEEDEETDA